MASVARHPDLHLRPSTHRWIWAIGVVGVALLSACASPGLMEGRYSCSPTDSGSCPAGWYCVLNDGLGEYRCYRDPGVECGDGGCDCGDGECQAGEDSTVCPADCYCGNGTCDGGEDSEGCELDCQECGDGVCGVSETGSSCPADCAVTCGDGTCQVTEHYGSCPQDCTCGNAICDATENATTCPSDCTADPVCGDGTCEGTESEVSCPADCSAGCTDPVCDTYPQCGCSGGQKCSLDSANNRACVTAGSTQPGSACTSDADCAAGAICISRDNAGTQGACLAWCNPDTQAGCTAATSYCLELSSGGVPIPGAGICTLTCQPHNPSGGCPAGFGCEIVTHNITQVTYTDCHADVGTGTYLSACDSANGPYCAVEYGCHNDGAPSSCYQWCVPGSSCATGTCDTTAFSPPLSVGGTTYGVCR